MITNSSRKIRSSKSEAESLTRRKTTKNLLQLVLDKAQKRPLLEKVDTKMIMLLSEMLIAMTKERCSISHFS